MCKLFNIKHVFFFFTYNNLTLCKYHSWGKYLAHTVSGQFYTPSDTTSNPIFTAVLNSCVKEKYILFKHCFMHKIHKFFKY